MARRSRVPQDDEEVELNMTPMLDVVFILLIFFIVTSVFIKEPGIEVERPDALTTTEANPSMLMAVTGENEIWINNRSYELSEVRPVIEQLLQENPAGNVMIQGDQTADIGTVLDLQELLIEMEVADIRISTLEP